MAIKRILITGAHGLLGQELIRQLAQQKDYKFLATEHRVSPRMPGYGVYPYRVLDICNSKVMQKVFTDFSPDCVINCAAMTGVDSCENDRDACWRVNAEAVGHLAKLCHGQGIHLLQLSTDFVFDGKQGPYREQDRPSPLNYYGKSKLAGENAARNAGVGKWTIVRTNVVYGHSVHPTRPDFVHWVIKNLTEHHPIQLYADQWRTPSYAHDLARGILRLVHFQKDGVYNLSGREFLNMYEFAQIIAEVFDLDASLIQPVVQQQKPQVAERPKRTGLVILKSETELNYRPLALRDALMHLLRRTRTVDTGDPLTDAWC